MPAEPKNKPKPKPEPDEGQRQAGLAVQARRHEMGRPSADPGQWSAWTKLLADTDVPVERRVMLASAVKVFDQAAQLTDNVHWDYQRNLGELILALVRQVDDLREQLEDALRASLTG